MGKRRRGRIARRWVVQGAVIAAVVGASAIMATLLSEGSTAGLPPAHVLGEPPLIRQDTTGLAQDVQVERPTGQLTVVASPVDAAGHIDVTVTDTRADDPGWTVGMTITDATGRTLQWAPNGAAPTPAFSDADGHTYAQTVATGSQSMLGSAPAGHGLGIAHLYATVLPDGSAGENGRSAVSLTVV